MAETIDTLDLSLLDEVFAKYEGKKGALIPILQRAQAVYGYLPLRVHLLGVGGGGGDGGHGQGQGQERHGHVFFFFFFFFAATRR